MKVTIDIPDPRFKVGDFVAWDDLVVHVVKMNYQGQWDVSYHGIGDFVAVAPQAEVRMEKCLYIVIVQPGSKNTKGVLMRPGTILLPYIAELDEVGSAACCPSRVVGSDTVENVFDRQEAWEAAIS